MLDIHAPRPAIAGRLAEKEDTEPSGKLGGATLERLQGLDSIRFIAALWVVLFHGSQPPVFDLIDRSTPLGRIARGLLDCVFCGPAAVIVFFVISGLCIHYPYTRGQTLNVWTFLARRYLRLLLPVLAVIAVSKLLSSNVGILWSLLLWSLYCELVYYTLYPPLLRYVRRHGWTVPIAVSCAGSLILSVYTGLPGMYARIDLWDPILGLPCWLMGCLLADRVAAMQLTHVSPVHDRIWFWRLGAWAGSSGTMLLMLHTPIGLKLSLLAFSCYAFFWLAAEIQHAHRARGESAGARILNVAGTASFSLYLTHPLAAKCVESLGSDWPLPGTLLWSARLAAVLLVAAIFYLLVEHPSHLLARSIGR